MILNLHKFKIVTEFQSPPPLPQVNFKEINTVHHILLLSKTFINLQNRTYVVRDRILDLSLELLNFFRFPHLLWQFTVQFNSCAHYIFLENNCSAKQYSVFQH